MITSPYVGQRVRYIGTGGIARVTRWQGSGATMRIWIRYQPNSVERVHWALDLEAYRPDADSKGASR